MERLKAADCRSRTFPLPFGGRLRLLGRVTGAICSAASPPSPLPFPAKSNLPMQRETVVNRFVFIVAICFWFLFLPFGRCSLAAPFINLFKKTNKQKNPLNPAQVLFIFVEVYLHIPTLRFLPAAADNSRGDVWAERKHWSVG